MRTRFILLTILVLGYGMFPCHAVLSNSHQDWRNLPIFSLPPFERAVRCIKYYEQLHTSENYPYVGYGHKIQPGEKLDYSITEQQADSLLRSDLIRLCEIFKDYGKYKILLATLSYNVGPYRILGTSRLPKSKLLQKIEKGNSDFEADYIEFCNFNGREVPSIKRRRIIELKLLLEE